jgi:hypothetical protein
LSARLLGSAREWLRPKYDEASMFMMAVASAAVVLTHPDLIGRVIQRLGGAFAMTAVILLIWALFGFAAVVFNALVRRPKSVAEKTSMAVFVLVTNAGAGAAIAFERLEAGAGLWLSGLNFAVALLLVCEIVLEEDAAIDDRDATFSQVMLGLAVVSVVFLFMNYVLRSSWAITFSGCVAYATLVHGILQRAARTAGEFMRSG